MPDCTPSSRIPNLSGISIQDGRLVLREVVGRGAWGVVYLAESTSSRKSAERFAVKVVRNHGATSLAPPPPYTNDNASITTMTSDSLTSNFIKSTPVSAYTIGRTPLTPLQREIELHRLCASASPRGVLPLLDVFHSHSSPHDDLGLNLTYMITEFFPEGDLLEAVMQGVFNGRDRLIKDVVLQILDGLEGCHRAGVYHRDMKPENVLVRWEEDWDGEGEGSGRGRGRGMRMRAVIADFGFATTEYYSKELRVGSEPFMSPEVLGGLHTRCTEYCTTSADVWAMGVIITTLATGCIPWERASLHDPSFYRYIHTDRDFLVHNFPISRGLNRVLKEVFTGEEDRVTVYELKEMVSGVKRFGLVNLEGGEEESGCVRVEHLDGSPRADLDLGLGLDDDDGRRIDMRIENGVVTYYCATSDSGRTSPTLGRAEPDLDDDSDGVDEEMEIEMEDGFGGLDELNSNGPRWPAPPHISTLDPNLEFDAYAHPHARSHRQRHRHGRGRLRIDTGAGAYSHSSGMGAGAGAGDEDGRFFDEGDELNQTLGEMCGEDREPGYWQDQQDRDRDLEQEQQWREEWEEYEEDLGTVNLNELDELASFSSIALPFPLPPSDSHLGVASSSKPNSKHWQEPEQKPTKRTPSTSTASSASLSQGPITPEQFAADAARNRAAVALGAGVGMGVEAMLGRGNLKGLEAVPDLDLELGLGLGESLRVRMDVGMEMEMDEGLELELDLEAGLGGHGLDAGLGPLAFASNLKHKTRDPVVMQGIWDRSHGVDHEKAVRDRVVAALSAGKMVR